MCLRRVGTLFVIIVAATSVIDVVIEWLIDIGHFVLLVIVVLCVVSRVHSVSLLFFGFLNLIRSLAIILTQENRRIDVRKAN